MYVIGGHGYVGSRVVAEAAERGFDVATWRAQLDRAAADGLFAFAETVCITSRSKPAGRP
jgi:nucleoside-diphosphate-sugar epimerase